MSPAKTERPWRVLVFPGGTEIGLEINSALRDCKEVLLFSAGMEVSSHATYVFAQHETVPAVGAAGWLEALNAVIAKHSIDLVFPAHDEVVLALSESLDRVAARVVGSPLRTAATARSKRATYELLQGHLPIPRVFSDPADIPHFPVFVKPDRGQGSQGARRIESSQALAVALAENPTLVVMEDLPGEEFTVDCLSDRERGLLFCSGRLRQRIRSGISVATRIVEHPDFARYAARLASLLEFHGAWFFQLKRAADGTLRVLEIAPRIAGAMALNRVRGVNFALLSLYEAQRLPFSVATNPGEVTLDRALIARYAPALRPKVVYVDLDDTLVLRGQVNLPLVRFLFQCINQGSELVLVTRHREDLAATLAKHRLGGLFDRVVHLQAGEPKSGAIGATDGAIFIDDSFRERQEVAAAKCIPTFDNSMIESLQDHRA